MIYLAIVYIRHGIFAKEFGMGVNKMEGKNNIKSEKGTEKFLEWHVNRFRYFIVYAITAAL